MPGVQPLADALLETWPQPFYAELTTAEPVLDVSNGFRVSTHVTVFVDDCPVALLTP